MGRCPCTYITVNGGMTYEEAEPLKTPYCGISYASDRYGRLGFMDKSCSWIGWDFGHCRDFNAMFPDYDGAKRAIAEVRRNIYDIVDEAKAGSK